MNADYTMTDSGNREHFDTGAMRERAPGKGRFDLISPFMLQRLAIIMEKGAAKYESRNWEKGMPFSDYVDSAERHIQQYKMGMTDEDHLGHAIFNLMAIMHLERTHPECDDMPKYLAGEDEANRRNFGIDDYLPEGMKAIKTEHLYDDNGKRVGSLKTAAWDKKPEPLDHGSLR